MPTKKLKGQPCVYCDHGASTREGDHVLAREFVPIVRRDRLPKVPACEPCNNRKSKLERDLVTVLSLGGRHTDAQEMLSGTERRLAKNLRLARTLREGAAPAVDFGAGGRPSLTLSVPLNGEDLLALTSLMARGLLFYHWQHRLAAGDVARAIGVTDVVDALFADRIFSMNGERAHVPLAEGALDYSVLRAPSPQSLSVWRFSFFGGAVATDGAGARIAAYWAFTGREQVIVPLLDSLQTT